MKILKRLLLVIGFAPVVLYASMWWIFTGGDVLSIVDPFIEWCNN